MNANNESRITKTGISRRRMIVESTGALVALSTLGAGPFLRLSSKANPVLISTGLTAANNLDVKELVGGMSSLAATIGKPVVITVGGTVVNLVANFIDSLKAVPFSQLKVEKSAPVHERFAPNVIATPGAQAVAPLDTLYKKPTALDYVFYPLLLPIRVARAVGRTLVDLPSTLRASLNAAEVDSIQRLYEKTKADAVYNAPRQELSPNAELSFKTALQNNPAVAAKIVQGGPGTPTAEQIAKEYEGGYWRPLEILNPTAELMRLLGRSVDKSITRLFSVVFRHKQPEPGKTPDVLIVTTMDPRKTAGLIGLAEPLMILPKRIPTTQV